jgi:hypothetical protein
MSWAQMTGDDRARHCQACKLNVYNLSDMTRREAESLIASREGRLCVRFYRRADGTVLTRDCPRGLRKQIHRISRFAGAALSALMSFGTVGSAQATQPPASRTETGAQEQKKTQILLSVIDPQGSVVAGAKFVLEDERGTVKATGTTRSDGAGIIRSVAPGSFLLRISHRGFEPYRQKIEIKKEQTHTLHIALQVHPEIVGILVLAPVRDPNDSQLTTTFSGDFLRQLPLR